MEKANDRRKEDEPVKMERRAGDRRKAIHDIRGGEGDDCVDSGKGP